MFGRKFDKGLLGGLLASLALHAGGGYEVNKVHKEVTQERLEKDRERVKDIIFLPSTQEELVQNLLEQAGVKTLEEIQKNPELAHKIDLGLFFIQVEFLEKKIDAKTAQKAALNLKLKRKVFKDLFDKTQDPLLVLNEIENEIVDPQLFVDENDLVENKKATNDYKKAEALISSPLINGPSNCYGSVKLTISIAQTALPNTKLKINELDQHVRIIAENAGKDYIVDPGAPIQEATEQNLAGTIVYDDAQLSFLSGLLHLPNPNRYIDGEREDTENVQKADDHTQTEDSEYKNTSIGNYFDFTPTTINNRHKLKKHKIEIPDQADRPRVPMNEDLDYKLPPEAQTPESKKNRKPEAIQKNIINSSKAAKAEIYREVEKMKAKNKKQSSKKEGVADTKDLEEYFGDYTPPSTDTEKTPQQDMQKLAAYQVASFRLQEYMMGVAEFPDKKAGIEKEITMLLKEIDDLGMLQKFATDHQEEMKKIEPLRPKPEEKSSSYLRAKFLVADYLKKYQELKNNFNEDKVAEETIKTLLTILKNEGKLMTGYRVTKNNDDYLTPDRYEIVAQYFE
ncbi:MAG: hypothetical protein NT034_03340, partial [Candidatus Magasanikbacteria bacterium]|nr:hypothetical protein [Candidatus Magasanikbacteria bacterium]